MKKHIIVFLILIISFFQAFAQKNVNDNFLYRICNNDYNCGYINEEGDTIINIGKYLFCYTDTIKEFGIVFKDSIGFIGINRKDSFLFKIFVFDNGPDLIRENLIRIIDDNGNIGYANSLGQIVIVPQYKCAYPFLGNKAKVSCDCRIIKDGEYGSWDSDNWFYINRNGIKIDSFNEISPSIPK